MPSIALAQKARIPEPFGAIVGTVATTTERVIDGENGLHLQFSLTAASETYQVDVNVQSADGSQVETCFPNAVLNVESIVPALQNGAPQPGIYRVPDASLSYTALGLNDGNFQPMAADAIEQSLDAALGNATLVVVWGLLFENPQGIHETHYDPDSETRDGAHDGAVAVYGPDAIDNPRWFFFKFNEQHLGVEAD